MEAVHNSLLDQRKPCWWLMGMVLLVLALLRPTVGWGQTTLVNYDFNQLVPGSSVPSASIVGTTATSGITAAFDASQATIAVSAGTASSPTAFTANSTGPAVELTISSGNNRYLQLALSGSALNNYSNYRLYFQPRRTTDGAKNITVMFSTDGNTFTALPTTVSVATTFQGQIVDLSAIAALNSQARVYFRLYASGASGNGALQLDNLQVQGTPTVAVTPFAGMIETFEYGSKAGYALDTVTLITGEWILADALIANIGADDFGTGKSTTRVLGNGFLAMNFDKPNGAGTITLKAAANRSSSSGGNFASFIVEVFDNGNTTGTPAYTSSPVTVTSSLQTYTFAANVGGNIRVKITSQNVPTNVRFNVDDIAISSITNQPPNQYTWTGQGGNSNWSNPNNWSPARTMPVPTDIIVFDGNIASPAIVALDFTASSLTIGQLQLRNLVSVVLLNSSSPRTLNLEGGLDGDDFTVGAGSVLTLRGSGGAPIVVNVTAGETALINGRVASETAGGNVANELTGQTTGAIVFGNGALFEAEAGVTGSPFGDKAANRQSVLFKAGATFRQEGGGNAFGLSQPDAVAVFEAGSTYQFAVSGSNKPSLSGRTFGTLEFANTNSGLANLTDSAPLVILNDLKIGANVKVGLNLTGGIGIGGNIVVEAGGSLIFAPVSASTLTLNGLQEQRINAPSPVVFGAPVTLRLNNAAGVRLQTPIRVNGTLDLQNGVLTSTATNLPTLAATASISGGSANSYVSGPVARELPIGTNTMQFFPVGKNGNYRPITLKPNQLDRGTLVMVEQQEGRPAPLAFNDAIQRVSQIRRFDIISSPALTAAQFIGTVTLSFAPDDQVTDPMASSLVIARTDGTGWNSLGRSVSTGTASAPVGTFVPGTLTSASFAGLGDFQTYTLASTEPDNTVNPLPVQLLSFGAERQAAGVQVRWTTATELNSASFEVQRSATGQEFRTIATVAAQGNSSSTHTYAALDRQPLPGLSYYRLRQLDLDGKAAYSAVVSVAGAGQLRAYPNPATTALTIEAPTGGGHYRVISLVGKAVLAGEMPTGTVVLNVAALSAGLYQLEVTTPAGRSTSKFFKQ
ncbi:T9SS type A sorting domain-containing protein [Hymenobacter aerophilus]|uniref:T9SS type A sorting domain-containing protein n=1 Tax=Hymenobacter aerophilus TaxID=119644 RepID=UPI00146C70C0|nr:T9SS type A sorting domain-containing protein [Hymenobacter aerophilus]